uniref:Uncharacterized protein n=1 Tax=Cannabis sativa TaxID=3483 RepID=A0A803R2H8_CANSA
MKVDRVSTREGRKWFGPLLVSQYIALKASIAKPLKTKILVTISFFMTQVSALIIGWGLGGNIVAETNSGRRAFGKMVLGLRATEAQVPKNLVHDNASAILSEQLIPTAIPPQLNMLSWMPRRI